MGDDGILFSGWKSEEEEVEERGSLATQRGRIMEGKGQEMEIVIYQPEVEPHKMALVGWFKKHKKWHSKEDIFRRRRGRIAVIISNLK